MDARGVSLAGGRLGGEPPPLEGEGMEDVVNRVEKGGRA